MKSRALLAGLALCALNGWAGVAAPPKKPAPSPAYNRDVRPILADNCFLCHGPDKGTRKANLRLDQPTPFDMRKILPRIFADQMPPPGSHRSLTTAQKETLRHWVAAGAPYEKHWGFAPIPPLAQSGLIDPYIVAKLTQNGLKPSPEADKLTLLRRVTLDITGVPPTIAEIDAYLADTKPGAYERVVDRLLASVRYGEQRALPWLDVARYADSYGYQSDQLSPTWQYRDWVVQAFNRNLPYSQFITEQLAGDLLPNPTRDQRLATAFNRLHRMTNEGGSVPEEWRMEYVADRVRTFGTAFLGLTLECARCHDHKYDPISQKEYYALSAFFNSIDEHGLYNQADIVPSPALLLPTPEQAERLKRAKQAVVETEAAIAQEKITGEARFQAWKNAQNPSSLAGEGWQEQRNAPGGGDLTGSFDFEAFDGARLPNRVPGAKDHGGRGEAVSLVPGKHGLAAQFDGENLVNFPQLGRFTRYTPFTIAFWLKDTRQEGDRVIFQACSGTDAGFHGYDLTIQDGILTTRLFRHLPGNALIVRAKRPVLKGVWTHVTVTYDGSSIASGLNLFVDGTAMPSTIVRNRLWKGTGMHTLVFGARFRDKGWKGGMLDDLKLYSRAITPYEVAQLAGVQRIPAESALRAYYFSAVDDATRALTAKLATHRQEAVNAEDAMAEIAVMEEMPTSRPTHVLARGQYDSPQNDANRVERFTPACLPPFPQNAPKNRLGLAQWLVDKRNPLTARVAVNRFWLEFFGRGLVETVEDFGIQGKLPTHPELLDALSADFQRDWDIKRLIRTMVTSATYRQSSRATPLHLAKDPQNLLLGRAPSYRLAAETIRDTALFSSGLLDEKRGGPPVSPYQPGDLWREANSMSPRYQQSVGTDLYRRSLYTVWKRTAPMPNMMAFDASSREVCTARRPVTSTPLQAFVLLNDPQFVEAARVLAERTLTEGGATDAIRLRYAFRTLATREPTEKEKTLLLRLIAEQRAFFNQNPDAAKKLIMVGASKPKDTLPPVELATYTVLAQTILNLDATLWKR